MSLNGTSLQVMNAANNVGNQYFTLKGSYSSSVDNITSNYGFQQFVSCFILNASYTVPDVVYVSGVNTTNYFQLPSYPNISMCPNASV